MEPFVLCPGSKQGFVCRVPSSGHSPASIPCPTLGNHMVNSFCAREPKLFSVLREWEGGEVPLFIRCSPSPVSPHLRFKSTETSLEANSWRLSLQRSPSSLILAPLLLRLLPAAFTRGLLPLPEVCHPQQEGLLGAQKASF